MECIKNCGPRVAQVRYAVWLAIFGLGFGLNGYAQYIGALSPSTQSGNVNLSAGTAANPIEDVYGLVITFSGDFSGVDENSIGVIWAGSWLMVNGGTGAHQWVMDQDENGATLTVWRTDEVGVSGYGHLLELDGATIVGELVLDDMAKQGQVFHLTSVNFLRNSSLRAYPSPCSEILFTARYAGEAGFPMEIFSADGASRYQGIVGDEVDVSSWEPAVYFVVEYGRERVIRQPITVVH
jgi:hypothetical protein